MTSTTDARLATLETAEAARNLLAEYATAVDTRDPDALRRVFAPDALLTSPRRRLEGIEAIVAFYEETFATNPCARRHFVTTVRVSDPTPLDASVSAYFVFTTASAGTSILGWGRYRDRVVRVDGDLRIAVKDITVDHQGSLADGWADRLATEVATR